MVRYCGCCTWRRVHSFIAIPHARALIPHACALIPHSWALIFFPRGEGEGKGGGEGGVAAYHGKGKQSSSKGETSVNKLKPCVIKINDHHLLFN